MHCPSPQDVLITGLGVVSPIGIGREAVWESLASERSGVHAIPELVEADWLAPFGGAVCDFQPKQLIQPRKSLKVMSWEIQLACGAAELARQSAKLEEGDVAPDRLGVVSAAPGFLFCELEEVRPAYKAWLETGELDIYRWGGAAMGELFPLWMLKYLPNLAGCHIGIRLDARGPTNTICAGDPSSLIAVAEAADVIRRGLADVMLVGGTGSNLSRTRMVWYAGTRLAQTTAPPETVCRPFDRQREGLVYGEGAAYFVLESRAHAARRGAHPLARIAGSASRCEPSAINRRFTGAAIRHALQAALESAELTPHDVGHVNAHGNSTHEDDPAEARSIQHVLPGVPVTAPKSFFGNLGPGSGAVELAVSLIALEHGQLPVTLNYRTRDPECPIEVVSQPREAGEKSFVALNHAPGGQSAALVVMPE